MNEQCRHTHCGPRLRFVYKRERGETAGPENEKAGEMETNDTGVIDETVVECEI